MASMAFYLCHIFVLGAFILLAKLTPFRFLFAVILSVFSGWTLSSGQLVWPIGFVFILAFSQVDGRKNTFSDRGFYLCAWMVIGLLFFLVNAQLYESRLSYGGMVGHALENIGHYIMFFFALLGSSLAFGSVWAATFFGVIVFSLFGLCCLFWVGRPSVLMFGIFLVLSMCMITVGRAGLSDSLSLAIVPRYSILSLSLVLVVMIVFLERYDFGRNYLVFSCLCVTSIAFYWGSYVVYKPMLESYLDYRVGVYRSGNYAVYGSSLEETNGVVTRAVSQGIYSPPACIEIKGGC